MKRVICKGLTCAIVCSVLFSTGCSLRPEEDYETKETLETDEDLVSTSSNMAEAEETEEVSTEEMVVVVDDDGSYIQSEAETVEDGEFQYETVKIEDLEEPVDDDGVWTDYILGTDELNAEWIDTATYGEKGVILHIENYPVIYVSDSEQEAEINQNLADYFQNYFVYRFQMKNLDVELTCTVLEETRFVSYQFEGMVYHTGDDARYEDEREYRYYVTIDRMTGTVINLETAYGVENAYNDILNGDYEVIRAEDAVFEKFEDDLLADVYVNEPAFEDDLDHEFDFYIEDGYVHVVVWVGEESGSYAILKLGKSKLQ